MGWVDLDLESSPGWWAIIVATFCPGGMAEYQAVTPPESFVFVFVCEFMEMFVEIASLNKSDDMEECLIVSGVVSSSSLPVSTTISFGLRVTADDALGCNSRDILNFGRQTGCKPGPSFGTTSVLGHSKFMHVSKLQT